MSRRAATPTVPCCALLLFAFSVHGAGRDYMSPEQRADVEELKQAAARAPTNLENLPARAEVLWRWANALSLTGAPVPQDLPVLAANLGRIDRADAVAAERWLEAVDGWIRELEIKDETPDALGSLRLSHAGPFPARSWQTIEQTWVVGSLGMAVGGGIEIGIDGFNDQGELQTQDPTAANYLSIRASRPGARFRPGAGHRGLTLPTGVVASFELEGARLEPGDTVTLVYGDRSRGSRGFELQSWSIDALHLPVYLDLEGAGHFLTPRWPSIEVVGLEEAVAVRATAPSVLEPGHAFTLAVRSEDRYYNRSSGEVPGYTILLAGEPVAELAPGDKGLTEIAGLRIEEPGVHRFVVRSEDGSLEGSSNPVWVGDDPPWRIYWGDTHGHTRYAEGQGSPDHYFRFARDDARLDFVVLSEHDIWMDDGEWETLRRLSRDYKEEGRFVPFLGYEWTRPPSAGGHHNVLFRSDVRWRVGAQVAPELARLYRALRHAYAPEDVLVVPHAHAPGDWRQSDPAVEKLVEIASTHGTFEFFGNRYLEQGWQVGFIGSSDNHHGHPGYPDTGTTFHTERAGLTAVLSAEKTADSLFAAMRGIRAYATSGERILLDARLDGEPMGTRLAQDTARRIRVRASGTAPIAAIEVIKNGDLAHRQSYLVAPLATRARVRVAFASSSEVVEHERPRGYRTWHGWLEVRGARLEDFHVLSLENRHRERIEAVPGESHRLEFTVFTRGRANAVLLALEGADSGTEIFFHLAEGRLVGGSGAGTLLPPEDFFVRLGQAREGPVVHEMAPGSDSGLAVDTVTVDLVDLEGELDRELEWTDMEPARPGDYYYVRVTQIDGERAWSSPFWVGERTAESAQLP